MPLLIVVPYAAFRSLAGEREDGTFELLSITTLSARQIVLGKLGSAILQMMVYYSALAPCIAFTYLLRGIDIITIALLLAYSFMASLLLSVFGLAMATVTKARHWQVLLSVVFVMALLYAMAYQNGFGLAAGTRFGALFGVFAACAFVVHNYVDLNIGLTLTAEQGVAYFVLWTLVGAAIGLIYRRSG